MVSFLDGVPFFWNFFYFFFHFFHFFIFSFFHISFFHISFFHFFIFIFSFSFSFFHFLIIFIFYFYIFLFFHFLFFYFSFFYFLFFIFHFSFFYFLFFYFSIFYLFIFWWRHHPPTPPSALFVLPHPPLPDFFLAFPKISEDFRRWPEPFPTFSEVGSWLRKIWSKGSHDVRLMRLSNFWYLLLIDISSDAFQQPIRSLHFPKIFPKIFQRCSRPIRSQEICDVIFGKSGQKGPTVLLVIICMERSVCQSIIKTWIWTICCIPRTNTVDRGTSSSTQVNWSSRCYHLALCADVFALNVILRWCTMGGGEVDKT